MQYTARFPGGAYAHVSTSDMKVLNLDTSREDSMYEFKLTHSSNGGTFIAFARLSRRAIQHVGPEQACRMMARNLQHELFRTIIGQ